MDHRKKKDRDLPPADYGDATPEDVARALLLYRPKPKKTDQAAAKASEADKTTREK